MAVLLLHRSRKASAKWFARNESKRLEQMTLAANDAYPPIWFHELISRDEADNRLENTLFGTYVLTLLCFLLSFGKSLSILPAR